MAETIFADLIRAYRERTGLSQEQVAHRLGVSRNYVGQIERGQARNVSFELGARILSLGAAHGKIEVELTRRALIDAAIGPEIIWLNTAGVVTEASCQGPPPTALIRPSSVKRARELGYQPELQDTGLYQIQLKSRVADDEGQEAHDAD
jgi:transcriptional regulator with XRE-family HTH domain